MTIIIQGDPELLASYTDRAARQVVHLGLDLDDVQSALTSFTLAGGFRGLLPLVVVESRLVQERLLAIDKEPAAFGAALVALDRNGDQMLNDAWVFGEPITASYLDLWVATYERNPFADPAVVTADVDELLLEADGLVTVVRDTPGQARVLKLDLVSLDRLEDLDPEQLQILLEGLRVVGTDGPVHFVMHGLNSTAQTSAEHAADLFDDGGVTDATVIAVEWDAGNRANDLDGYGGLVTKGIDFSQDFDRAESNGRDTGDAFAEFLTALYAADPGVNVSMTAHSLGNHVGLRGVSQMEVPIDPHTGHPLAPQIDFTSIQPAIPGDVLSEDYDAYRALVDTDRISTLTLTINDGDNALNAYNASHTDALGEKGNDASEINDIRSQRDEAGGRTLVLDHGDQTGGWGDEGHLTIDPAKIGTVRWLYEAQVLRSVQSEEGPLTIPPHDDVDDEWVALLE